jgi:DNA invertase Pin-like site-specific DNA recombinase
MTEAPASRCAIYTRKSSEEGLEQGFNSLDAQREACAAYVLSQAGMGWVLGPGTYDDGGYSGGSMERPGLKALIADIEQGKVDIVVVYKVDRLTRSLADFARLVELFERRQVSFVSVTQAFNTTTSMGRLTLNVLLSFAQFEREVTGERIRDKIAASKAKGLWMGGRPPLGYDAQDRKLEVNAAEAAVVEHIYRRYLQVGSVASLVADLAATSIRSKRWIAKSGAWAGGGAFGRGALYHLLSNPVYRGAIRHKDKVYPDTHAAIIDQALWDEVQARLQVNGPDRADGPKGESPAWLKQKLVDARGVAMTPTYTKRKGKRYRYYAAQDVVEGRARSPHRTSRMPAGLIEMFVEAQALPRIRPEFQSASQASERLRAALVRVQVSDEAVELGLYSKAASSSIDQHSGEITRFAKAVYVRLPIVLKHRQGALVIQGPGGPSRPPRLDRALVRAVCLARVWAMALADGKFASLKDIARQHRLCERYVGQLLPLAWLAPDLVDMILNGNQPEAVSLAALIKEPLPLLWAEQRRLFVRLG